MERKSNVFSTPKNIERYKSYATSYLNRDLNGVTFSRMNVGDDDVKEICEILVTYGDNLKYLIMKNNKITSKGAGILAEWLKNKKSETIVYLCDNNDIGDEGFAMLIDAVVKNTNIKSLDVSNCGITDVGMAALPCLVGNNSLDNLSIRYNTGITDASFPVLEGVIRSSYITSVGVYGTGISEANSETLDVLEDTPLKDRQLPIFSSAKPPTTGEKPKVELITEPDDDKETSSASKRVKEE